MLSEWVLIVLEQALTLRQLAPDLIIHADRGNQYTSAACRTRIEKAQALASCSRPGNPYARAHSKPSCFRTAGCLPASKRLGWRAPITSTPTSTSLGATPRSATAPHINSNATSKPAYLSAVPIFTGPPHHAAPPLTPPP